jgi:hypothetical protein
MRFVFGSAAMRPRWRAKDIGRRQGKTSPTRRRTSQRSTRSRGLMDGGDIVRGDIVLVPFPYVTDFKRAKTRPALIIQNNVGNRFGSTVY